MIWTRFVSEAGFDIIVSKVYYGGRFIVTYVTRTDVIILHKLSEYVFFIK